ncbi:MAG: type I restriction enzyme HsdR N-terminal domain-containing protein [Flavobacteriia bacterium]
MANLKLSKKDNSVYVWCEIRKKNLVLTPEEWVRQHLIHYLVYHKKFPKGLIASEIEIKANKQKRRCDLVVFDSELKPRILIECKAPEINLNLKVVQQIIHYNNQLQVPVIAISNGLQHEIISINYETNEFVKLDDFVL